MDSDPQHCSAFADLGEHEEVGESGGAEAKGGDENNEPDEVVPAGGVLVLERHDRGDQATENMLSKGAVTKSIDF